MEKRRSQKNILLPEPEQEGLKKVDENLLGAHDNFTFPNKVNDCDNNNNGIVSDPNQVNDKDVQIDLEQDEPIGYEKTEHVE